MNDHETMSAVVSGWISAEELMTPVARTSGDMVDSLGKPYSRDPKKHARIESGQSCSRYYNAQIALGADPGTARLTIWAGEADVCVAVLELHDERALVLIDDERFAAHRVVQVHCSELDS